MKSRTLTCITAMALFAALLIPVQLAAQQSRYKLVDLGTFGGPNSSVPMTFFEINGSAGDQVLSSQGIVTGTADSSTPDPLCFFDDCFFPNAFKWRSGVLTNLGALPGSQWSSTNWISGNGLIAGISQNGETDAITGTPEGRAVLWQGGGIVDLGTLPGGFESFAWAVNNGGQVVGIASNTIPDPFSFIYGILGSSSGTQSRAFLWTKQNGMQDLGTLGGPDAWPGLVNEQGQTAGISYTSFTTNPDNAGCTPPNFPTVDPFFWDRSTGMLDIGTFGGTCGVPNALNNRGQVAGQSYLAGNLVAHAFLWQKSANPPLKDLGTLGGDNAGALWLNDAGAVVGYADLPPSPPGCTGLTCVHHAFLWKNGVITDLGSIGTDPCSRALSINSRGQIVGLTAAVCGGAATHGFLWEKGGPMIDLNTLVAPGSGLTLNTPTSINDRGEIAGFGTLANGNTHAFVLTPCGKGTEGCGDAAESATAARPTRSAPAFTNSPVVPQHRLAPSEGVYGWGGRLAQRYQHSRP